MLLVLQVELERVERCYHVTLGPCVRISRCKLQPGIRTLAELIRCGRALGSNLDPIDGINDLKQCVLTEKHNGLV